MEKVSRARLILKKSDVYFNTYQWFYRGTRNLLKAGIYFENIKEANSWLKSNYEVVL